MNLNVFLDGLSEVAQSPLAFIAYCLIALAWGATLWKESRFKNILQALEQLPKNKRLEALKLEYQLTPKEGLTANEFLSLKRRQYYLLAFGVSVLAFVLISTLTLYRYMQLDKANVAQETMNIAYETFIRGTTTADDNRFKESIGKLEEALEVNPSYSGYINLADIYDEVGDVDGALWASQNAALLDPKNPSPENNIGMFFMDKGQLSQAETHLKKAMGLFEDMEVRDDEFKVSLLVNLGNVYYEMAEAAEEDEQKELALKAKEECFDPALSLQGRLQNKRFLAVLLGNAANTYRLLEDYDKAEELMFRSISLKENLAKKSPLWSSLGIGYFNLGEIYMKRNSTTNAKKYFELSQDIFEASDYVIGLGSIDLAFGDIAQKEGNEELAIEHWNSARSLFSASELSLYTQKANERLNNVAAD